MGAEETEGDAGEGKGEGGEEDVGRWDAGGAEGVEEVFACAKDGGSSFDQRATPRKKLVASNSKGKEHHDTPS